MTGNSSAPPPPVDEAVMQLLSHREAFLPFYRVGSVIPQLQR